MEQIFLKNQFLARFFKNELIYNHFDVRLPFAFRLLSQNLVQKIQGRNFALAVPCMGAKLTTFAP
jgi:hypothetical protein